MSNNSKQNGLTFLIVVLTIALLVGIVTVGKKLQDAHVKSIEKTIAEQFKGGAQ